MLGGSSREGGGVMARREPARGSACWTVLANGIRGWRECRTCLGAGRIKDGETGEPRRCLDCGGSGQG